MEPKKKGVWIFVTQFPSVLSYWTRMYPMVLMSCHLNCSSNVFKFPHGLAGPEPNPILESRELQLPSLLPKIPILALENRILEHPALNPSLLQLLCSEACEPISASQVSRPSVVARYCPSAISAYREVARLFKTINLI